MDGAPPPHRRTNSRMSIRIKQIFTYLQCNSCHNFFCNLHLIRSLCLWEYPVAAWVTSHSERATSFIRSQQWLFYKHIKGRNGEGGKRKTLECKIDELMLEVYGNVLWHTIILIHWGNKDCVMWFDECLFALEVCQCMYRLLISSRGYYIGHII